jgi:hypothetical protein
VTPAPTTIPVTEPSTTIPVTEPSTTVPVTANTTAPKPTTPKTTTPTTQAPAVSGTPAEITQKLAGSLGNAANTAQTETDPIYASIYKKYQSSGLTIRIPAGMYPPGATATTPRDSLAYEVSGGGQTWCLEKVRDPDAAKFYYVQRDGGC